MEGLTGALWFLIVAAGIYLLIPLILITLVAVGITVVFLVAWIIDWWKGW